MTQEEYEKIEKECIQVRMDVEERLNDARKERRASAEMEFCEKWGIKVGDKVVITVATFRSEDSECLGFFSGFESRYGIFTPSFNQIKKDGTQSYRKLWISSSGIKKVEKV